jgi:hypothetical protein
MFKVLPRGQYAWILVLIAACTFCPRPSAAQPSPNDPPLTYEVQIDGESFQVEGNQRPIKLESKLKPGTTYSLALRVSMTQVLRLNSVKLQYGMSAKVDDNKGKEIRVAHINHELGFGVTITDVGAAFPADREDELLKLAAEDVAKRYTENKAQDVVTSAAKTQKFGQSNGKWLKVTCKDAGGEARSAMIFVLSGDKYTVSAVAEYRDKDFEDVMPWVRDAICSIQPLR